MKKLILTLPALLLLSACGPATVMFPVVLGAGVALNVENSGDPIDTPKEALDRTVDAVVEGYSREENTSFELNE